MFEFIYNDWSWGHDLEFLLFSGCCEGYNKNCSEGITGTRSPKWNSQFWEVSYLLSRTLFGEKTARPVFHIVSLWGLSFYFRPYLRMFYQLSYEPHLCSISFSYCFQHQSGHNSWMGCLTLICSSSEYFLSSILKHFLSYFWICVGWKLTFKITQRT